jgi:putative spermidine/putrescine transport system permease protein
VRRRRLTVLGCVNVLVAAFVLLPLVVVIYVSFTPAEYLRLPAPGEVSLRWYREMLHRPDFGDALVKSLWLGAATTGISLVVGSLAAYGLVRYRFPGRMVLGTLFMAPLMVPGVVLGLFLLIFFASVRLDGTFTALVAGHVLITMPYVVRTMYAGFAVLDPQLELAARNLGARGPAVAARVIVPLMRPAVLAAAGFAFLMSFDNLTLSLFLVSPGFTTLPVRMYYYVTDVTDPMMAAVSTCLIAGSCALVLLLERLVGVTRFFGGQPAGAVTATPPRG